MRKPPTLPESPAMQSPAHEVAGSVAQVTAVSIKLPLQYSLPRAFYIVVRREGGAGQGRSSSGLGHVKRHGGGAVWGNAGQGSLLPAYRCGGRVGQQAFAAAAEPHARGRGLARRLNRQGVASVVPRGRVGEESVMTAAGGGENGNTKCPCCDTVGTIANCKHPRCCWN